jgi:Astacin (Peptidase family M12A)
MSKPITCTPKMLPPHLWVAAAKTAVEANPANHPRLERLSMVFPGFQPTPERIAVVTKKFWGSKGVRLTVGFLDDPTAELRARILSHMNAWSKTANVSFVETESTAQVRIARTEGDGYWSYVGTDISHIALDQPTMNLDSFSMSTPDSEFHRVVRHETGHTLGCPHEHMRRELVAKIDPTKAITYFGQTQGWDPETVRQQVLTPIEESSLLGTTHPDSNSIMCYQIPSSITKDGKPILGGTDIDNSDYTFMGAIYPKPHSHPAISVPNLHLEGLTSSAEISVEGTLRIAWVGQGA